jgi:hypothetical protein
MHKLGTRSNHVFIELVLCLLQWLISELDFLLPLVVNLLFSSELFLNFKCGTESSTSLLVHFGSWCNTINRHIDEFLRPRYSNDLVYVLEYIVEHLCIKCWLWATRRSGAWMNDSVHIEI